MNDELVIKFQNEKDRDEFVEAYTGDCVSYHPNYNGSTSTRNNSNDEFVAILNRPDVKDFNRLNQDITLKNGKADISE